MHSPSRPNAPALETFFETLPVNGPFSITAELPDMAMVIRYQEKDGLPSQGYYRLVRPPWYRALQSDLLARAPGYADVLLYPTPELAMHAVLDYLSVACRGRTAFAPAAFKSVLQAMRLESVSDPAEADHCCIVESPNTTGGRSVPCILYGAKDISSADTDYIIQALGPAEKPLGAALFIRDAEAATALMDRNKKRGAVLSSRHLARLTGNDPESTPACKDVTQSLNARLRELEQADYALLYSSGMHAVSTMMDVLKTPDKNHFLIIGHVYSDTHYLMTEIPWPHEPLTVDFLNSNEGDQVSEHLNGQTAAIFVETLTNPLNEVPDLDVIIEQAKARGVPVIVDNTMASPKNCQPLTLGAAAVIHSTTKYLSGQNIHGGGVTLTNDPDLAQRLRSWSELWGIHMSPYEQSLLWDQIQDFEVRMERFNRNGQAVAEYLEAHPKVKQVFYCGLPSSPYHATSQRLLKGGASVVSFLLHEDSMEGVTRFYDSELMPLRKAPTLGSNMTLMCPYTLLTYYHKSDAYLNDIPLSRYLIRLAVGCEEELAPVLEALGRGLDAV